MPKIEIPADVLDRAAHAANPDFPARPEALDLTTFAGEIVDWLAKEYRLDDDRHLVKVDEDGWTVQHPLSCRPNLFTCQWSDGDLIYWGAMWDSLADHPHEPGIYTGGTIPDPQAEGRIRLILCDRVGDVDDGQ